MSGLCALINWDGSPVQRTDINRMLALIKHRGPDGLNLDIKRNIGLGHANFILNKSQNATRQPVWLPDESLGIVADCSLYNRKELLAKLPRQSWWVDSPSDAEIILAGFEKYHTKIFDLLEGDFSVVIFDKINQEVFASKDIFSSKPLFFYWDSHIVALASEIKQILSLPEVSLVIDNVIIGEHLFSGFEEAERTFFDNVKRVRPGHVLRVNSSSVSQYNFWSPRQQRDLYGSKDEYYAAFRERLKKSVSRRLDTDDKVLLHLSGGMDSTSIAALAAECLKDNAYPGLVMLSASFEGMGCDETREIDEFVKTLSMEHHYFKASNNILEGDILEDLWASDMPYLDIQRSRMHQASSLAKSLGAKVTLTGVGGDEITTEHYFLTDLASRMRYSQLLYECVQMSKMEQGASSLRFFVEALKPSIPMSIKHFINRFRSHTSGLQPPRWMEQQFFDQYQTFPHVSKDVAAHYPSRLQQFAYETFLDPYYHWSMEVWAIRDAYDGLETRHPFMDRELLEFVLNVPLDARLPVHGRPKQLIRRGLQGYLTPGILDKRLKTTFEGYVAGLLTGNLEVIKEMLFGADIWSSGSYINKKAAKRFFDDWANSNTGQWYNGARSVWTIFTLELWLRQIKRYKI